MLCQWSQLVALAGLLVEFIQETLRLRLKGLELGLRGIVAKVCNLIHQDLWLVLAHVASDLRKLDRLGALITRESSFD